MVSTLPRVTARGSWGNIGYTLGKQLAPLIRNHLNAWLDHVVNETGCDRDDAVQSADVFAEPVQTYAPCLWEELDGMARGSGLSVVELLVLQARTEVLRLQQKDPSVANGECTTFAVGQSRTVGGHVLFGHNVDLPVLLEPFGVIVQHEPDDAPATLMYTAAGLLGQNGLNDAGVGVCANFIEDPAGWGIGFPRYLLSRLALRGETAQEAMCNVTAPARAASRNLLIADRSGDLLSLELLIQDFAVLQKHNDLLIHTNHLEAEQFAGLDTPEEDSVVRRERMQQLFDSCEQPVSAETLESFFRDHHNGLNSLCVHTHAESYWQTIVSVIGNLSTNTLHVAKGTPCRFPYESYQFE